MKTAEEKLRADEKFYLLVNYAMLAATLTIILGGLIALAVLVLNMGLL